VPKIKLPKSTALTKATMKKVAASKLTKKKKILDSNPTEAKTLFLNSLIQSVEFYMKQIPFMDLSTHSMHINTAHNSISSFMIATTNTAAQTPNLIIANSEVLGMVIDTFASGLTSKGISTLYFDTEEDKELLANSVYIKELSKIFSVIDKIMPTVPPVMPPLAEPPPAKSTSLPSSADVIKFANAFHNAKKSQSKGISKAFAKRLAAIAELRKKNHAIITKSLLHMVSWFSTHLSTCKISLSYTNNSNHGSYHYWSDLSKIFSKWEEVEDANVETKGWEVMVEVHGNIRKPVLAHSILKDLSIRTYDEGERFLWRVVHRKKQCYGSNTFDDLASAFLFAQMYNNSSWPQSLKVTKPTSNSTSEVGLIEILPKGDENADKWSLEIGVPIPTDQVLDEEKMALLKEKIQGALLVDVIVPPDTSKKHTSPNTNSADSFKISNAHDAVTETNTGWSVEIKGGVGTATNPGGWVTLKTGEPPKF
jgi:hypothetical protein